MDTGCSERLRDSRLSTSHWVNKYSQFQHIFHNAKLLQSGLVWEAVFWPVSRPEPRVRGKQAHDGVTSPTWSRCAFCSTGVGWNPAQYPPTHACLKQLHRTPGTRVRSRLLRLFFSRLDSLGLQSDAAATTPSHCLAALPVSSPTVGSCAFASSSYPSSMSSSNLSSPSMFFLARVR
jgi:hypothetical protein